MATVGRIVTTKMLCFASGHVGEWCVALGSRHSAVTVDRLRALIGGNRLDATLLGGRVAKPKVAPIHSPHKMRRDLFDSDAHALHFPPVLPQRLRLRALDFVPDTLSHDFGPTV